MVSAGTGRGGTREASPRALWQVAYGLVMLQAGSVLVAPLYVLYQRWWGLRSSLISALFAIFVVGVIFGLLVVSPSADLWGRRRTLLGASVLALLSYLVYMAAGSVREVAAANLLQGLCLGAFTGTAPPVLYDLAAREPARVAGRVSTFATAMGLALGPLWSGWLLQYAPLPGRLVFAVHAALVAPLVWWLPRLPERRQAPGPRRAARAAARLRRGQWRRFLAVAMPGFYAFAIGGLFVSIGPLMVDRLLGVRNSAISGLTVAVLFGSSGAVQALSLPLGVHALIRLGLVALAAGLILLLAALGPGGLAVFLLSAVLLGAGQGMVLQGGVAAVTAGSSDERRTGMVSAFYLTCYAGTALSALSIGAVIAAAGLGTAAASFAVAAGALSLAHAVALPALLRRPGSAGPGA